MLRGIAHEIRNPLGGIELFSGILKEKISDEDAQKSIDRIIQETNNLKKLVDEFLHFAKNPVIQLKKTDLDEFFDDVHFHWKKRLLEENIEWDVHLDGKQSIEWDVDQMKRVFHNIIENSIQAMDKEIKRIHIEISSEKITLFFVSRTMDAEYQLRIKKNFLNHFLQQKHSVMVWGWLWFKRSFKHMVVILKFDLRKKLELQSL